MEEGMKVARGFRNRIEAMERAGLDYIDKRRLTEPSEDRDREGQAIAGEAAADISDEVREEMDLALKSTQDARLKKLTVLRNEIANCTKCPQLASSRTQTVFCDGTPFAELCFVGEAPGADEDLQGIPFVGRAGQLLTKIIEACGLKREEVYICNVLKCRPPENRNPTPIEVENCKPYLVRQLDLVQPKMLVALGKFAAAHLLGEKPERVPIMKLRGSIREYNGIPFMITLHPAYLLRNPEAKREVWEDMKEVMRRLGRPVA